ncbi:MAG: amidase, partial [Nannocystaceae bacterium]
DGVETARLIANKSIKAEEVLDAAIRGIEAVNGQLNAVVHLDIERARATLRETTGKHGPLFGVPFLLKDLGAEDLGQPCTGSSRLLADAVADHDAELVRRFRDSGLITLGRTNTPEFGLMGITEPALRGPARNPWSVAHTPGGSSGGAAAAVASRMVPLAHGGDGGGSIRIPASHCGLVGLKPTRARTPAGPVRGEGWAGFVCEHVLTRTVRDCAAVLDQVHGTDPGAPYQVAPPLKSYGASLADAPEKLRVAVCRDALLGSSLDPECIEAVERGAAMCAELGHEVFDVEVPMDVEALSLAYLRIVAAGTAARVAAAERAAKRLVRADDIEPATRLFAAIGGAMSAATYMEEVQRVHAFGRTMGRFFEDVDVLITATVARPPARVGELSPSWGESVLARFLAALKIRPLLNVALKEMAKAPLAATPNTQPFNMTGQPAISLPLHRSEGGLPVGTQFVGRFGDEAALLRLAGQLEASARWADERPPVCVGAPPVSDGV